MSDGYKTVTHKLVKIKNNAVLISEGIASLYGKQSIDNKNTLTRKKN